MQRAGGGRRCASMRVVKIVGFVLGGLLVVVLAAGLAIYFGGGPAVAWVLQHPASAMIGRQITIGGPVTVHWGAPTRIVIEDLHVANASWSRHKDMLSARRLELEIFARTLIEGPTRIPLLSLDGAKLLLETSDKGEGNWKFSTGTPKTRSQSPLLQHVALHDCELAFFNGETQAQANLGVASLTLEDPDPASPVKFAAAGTFQTLPLHLAGTFGALSELRDSAKPYPVKLDGALDQIKIAVDGTIKEPLAFNGLDLRLSLAGSKFDELGSTLGVPIPELPDFHGTSKLTGGKGLWHIGALTLQFGKSDLDGGIDININEKVPRLKVNLTSSRLDLADFKGLYGGNPDDRAPPPPPPDPSWPRHSGHADRGEEAAGHQHRSELRWLADRRRRRPAVRTRTLGLKIEDGQLTIDPLTFHVALGNFALRAHYDPFTASTPPHLQAKIDIQQIDLHSLLGGPAMPDIVKETAGTVGGFITLDTTGTSLRQFLGRANGDVGIFVANGKISALAERLAPLDVLGVLGVYASGDKPQPINCLVSRFDVRSGVATASTLLVKTPRTTIVGSGNINFASETLYLALKPYNNSFTPISLRSPVDILGTFKKPDFHVAAAGLAARAAAAVGLGVLFPPAALVPFVDAGLGNENACKTAMRRRSRRRRHAEIGQQQAGEEITPLSASRPAVGHGGAALAHRLGLSRRTARPV